MAPKNPSVEQLLAETQDLVSRLLRENRALKAHNTKLSVELERVSKGWEQIKALARKAPRSRRR
jgi:hypothetical protein